jgi:hypothetical protein
VITRFNGDPSNEPVASRTIADGCGSGGALESQPHVCTEDVRERARGSETRARCQRKAAVSHAANSASRFRAGHHQNVQAVAGSGGVLCR